MPAVTFNPPKSKNIGSLIYDADQELLAVLFKSGYTYTHSQVPAKIYDAMTKALSPGSYYHSVIKVHYPLVRKQHGTSAEAEAQTT